MCKEMEIKDCVMKGDIKMEAIKSEGRICLFVPESRDNNL